VQCECTISEGSGTMLGQVTINSCAENYRFITLFSQVRIDSGFGANGQMRRICWRCAKFLACAKLSMAKFGASVWMRQTFWRCICVRRTYILRRLFLRHKFGKCASAMEVRRTYIVRRTFFCAPHLEVRDIFLRSKMRGGFFSLHEIYRYH
jgi:hypothetical protein